MPIRFITGDITQIKADAIVNAAKNSLLGGGGVDGAIHSAAGPELLRECSALGGCKTGEAKITNGYNLSAKYVIHTVGPVWQDGKHNEKELLISCYRNSLRLAGEYSCSSVAFPLISSGVYGYPLDKAIADACEAISSAPETEDMDVMLVFYTRPRPTCGLEKYTERSRDEMYFRNAPPLAAHSTAPSESASENSKKRFAFSRFSKKKSTFNYVNIDACSMQTEDICEQEKTDAPALNEKPCISENQIPPLPHSACRPDKSAFSSDSDDLSSLIKNIDNTFADLLFTLIDSKGMTDSECYKKANISRKLFSKIKCDSCYHPEKKTVLAFAIALELSIAETNNLLARAGYTLTDCSPFDIIINYYISHGEYNIYKINEALFEYDQPLLGSVSN